MFSEQHKQVQGVVTRFADEVIRPAASDLDDTERFPTEIYQQMGEIGLFGITVPDMYGGVGMDALAYAVVMEELSRGYASVADQCGLVELLGTLLSCYGSEAQRERYLGAVLRAELRGAYCITEAGAGSDVSGLRTVARRDGSDWILSGEKLWIHNAPVCDFAIVLARTDKERGHRGMSIFIVDMTLSGVTAGPKEHKMGQRASQVGALHFDDVRLPADALLGQENRGFHIMMSVLDKGRIGISSLAVGIIQGALDASLEYAGQRRQFDKAIGEFQGVQWMLADMATAAQAARLLTRSAAMKFDTGARATTECSMAKCFSGDAAVKSTADAVQIYGGSGYIRGFEVERLYRDAKITQIYEGTNQIQRMIIARRLLAGEV